MICTNQTYYKTNTDELITCALTSQYRNDFERSIPASATIALTVLNVLFAIEAALLNLLIIIAIMSTPKLQTPTFILLCNLALTDFLISVVIGPFEIMYLVTRALQQYDMFCMSWKILVAFSYTLCPASLYTITCISYDRYLSLLLRVKYKSVVTKKKSVYVVICIWVWSILGASFIGILGKGPFLILVCCVTFLCLAVIWDCYFMSFNAIKERQLEIKSSASLAAKEYNSNITSHDVMKSRENVNAVNNSQYCESEILPGIVPKEAENVKSVAQKPNHSPPKVRYLKINKDFASIVEKIESNDESKEINTCKSSRDNLGEHVACTSQHHIVKETTRTSSVRNSSSRNQTLPMIDVEKFRKTLHTILIIVFVLFLCFLPYLVVSTLVTLKYINIGVAWDVAGIIVYMNSSVSPIILCTRIANVRKACLRILRKMC